MDPQLQQARTRDGVTIAWVSVGQGPSLIHLPGVPFSHLQAEWRIPVVRRAFEGLARNLRLIQYDGRGSGTSQRDVSDLSFEAMLADLDAVVAASGVERATLLGFYDSVPLAIAYAARHPMLVTSLILFGGSTRGWTPMSGSGTQALLSLMERDWDMFVESATHAWLGWPDRESGRLAADWFRTATTPAVAREVMRMFSGVDVSAEAATVGCPVLVLHRRDAQVIPLAISEELATALPDAQLRIVEGSSASLFFEPNEAIVRDIVEFVTGGSDALRSTGTARPPATRDERPSGLTPRELEVLRLIAGGGSNAEIAHRLGLSVNTVERHVSNLYRKIDARGRADATAFAVRRGIA
jgi:DNA-binding CsgD family transcriptional regulator/pimeloyl-ACP methyl ester carboxylesterase